MRTDPVEKIVESALTAAKVKFEDGNSKGLDFYLPDFQIYIECKQMHTPRAIEQMSRHPDAILIQGIHAANVFASLINMHTPEPPNIET